MNLGSSVTFDLFAPLMFAGLHNHFPPKTMFLLVQAWLINRLLYRIKNTFFLRDTKHNLESRGALG